MDIKEKLENELYRLDNEGDGYYFTGYTSEKYMPDEKSKILFTEALNAINNFRKYLEENTDENKSSR